jgi:hypothetical protein
MTSRIDDGFVCAHIGAQDFGQSSTKTAIQFHFLIYRSSSEDGFDAITKL